MKTNFRFPLPRPLAQDWVVGGSVPDRVMYCRGVTTMSCATSLFLILPILCSVQAVPTTDLDDGLAQRSTESSGQGEDTRSASSQPKPFDLTSGLAIAGVILSISGIFYALIGVGKRRFHIFWSAVYLTSLAITVLITYLVDPPISEAIQGAYVTAAAGSGLIVGVLTSLYLSEYLEGLACLLGGFCFSMWLLVLRPGGLIHNYVGKVVFISVLTAIGYGLSFPTRTREYALIASMSFAGGTVIILGADCFGRTGLKEFWFYLWSMSSSSRFFRMHADKFPRSERQTFPARSYDLPPYTRNED